MSLAQKGLLGPLARFYFSFPDDILDLQTKQSGSSGSVRFPTDLFLNKGNIYPWS